MLWAPASGIYQPHLCLTTPRSRPSAATWQLTPILLKLLSPETDPVPLW